MLGLGSRAAWRRLAAGGLVALAALAARAQATHEPTADPPADAASAPSAQDVAPPMEPASQAKPAPAGDDKVEGAIGLLLRYGAAYSGGSTTQLKPNLGGFLRWGRFTVSGAGGFTTRRKDDVDRGLSADLLRRENFRFGVALRVSTGRDQSDSPELAGMGHIKSTVRAQFAARWTPAPGWGMSGTLNLDVLNRAGGYYSDLSVSREWALMPGQRLIASASLGAAGDRYLQVWHGVTREQSIASGYPEYRPKEGLRDFGLGLTWRVEFAERWAGFVTLGHTELLSSVRRSPLTRDPGSNTLSGGVARRF